MRTALHGSSRGARRARALVVFVALVGALAVLDRAAATDRSDAALSTTVAAFARGLREADVELLRAALPPNGRTLAAAPALGIPEGRYGRGQLVELLHRALAPLSKREARAAPRPRIEGDVALARIALAVGRADGTSRTTTLELVIRYDGEAWRVRQIQEAAP